MEALDSIISKAPFMGMGSDSYSYDDKKKLYLPENKSEKDEKQAPILDINTKKQVNKTDGKNEKKDDKKETSFWSRIDSRLENLLKPSAEKPGAANKKNTYEKSTAGKIAWDIAKYSPFLIGQVALFGPKMVASTFITAAGLAFGNIADQRKKKKNVTWNQTKRELYTGNTLGLGEYTAFSSPEYVMNAVPGFFPKPGLTFDIADVPAQLIRTLLFNPILVYPFNYIYKGTLYFRDHVGLGPTIGGLMTGKIFKYGYDAHKKGIMPTYRKDTGSVSKTLFPLHHIQLNYETDPTIRMVQSLVVNNPIFRFINRDKSGEKTATQYKKAA